MMNNIIDSVIAHSGKQGHPRIMLTAEDFKRIGECDDPIYKEGMKNIFARIDRYMDGTLIPYDIPDGIRLLNSARYILERALELGMAYRVTGEARYAERLWRELENAADFKDWNPRHFLDVGELSCAFGIGYDWIYDWMNESQRKKLRRAVVEKAFLPAMDDYLDRERNRTWHWYQATPGNNWKFVCNGGITVALLAICDEDDMNSELCQTVFERAFDSTYAAVRNLYSPDGSYAEGSTYWNYATCYLGNYTNALKSACGTDFGLSDWEPVVTSALYIRSMCSGNYLTFNFGDAVEVKLCSDNFLFIGKNYGRPDISAMRVEYLKKNPREINWRDLIFYRPAEGRIKELPLDCGSVGATNASFRSGWGEDDLFAAIHFGANNVSHAHADMGSFVIDWGGKRFFTDYGQDNYNLPDYYLAYRFRAEGHNTLVINPVQYADQVRNCESYISAYRTAEEGDGIAVADLSVAYGGKGGLRGMRMTHDRRAVIIRDELTLDPTDTVYWFGQTRAKIELSADRRAAVLNIDGVRMWAGLLADGEFYFTPATHLDPKMIQKDQRDNSEYSRLTVKLTGSGVISVCFIPLADGEREPRNIPRDLPICKW